MKKETINTFFRLSEVAQEEKRLDELYKLFFTPEELEILSARADIIEALLKGELTQREMAQKYKVSIAQITRGSNALKSVSSGLKKLLARFSW